MKNYGLKQQYYLHTPDSSGVLANVAATQGIRRVKSQPGPFLLAPPTVGCLLSRVSAQWKVPVGAVWLSAGYGLARGSAFCRVRWEEAQLGFPEMGATMRCEGS